MRISDWSSDVCSSDLRTGQYADRAPFVRFVQKELRADGKKNDPITVVDARNHLWDPDVKIGNESLVEVKANVVDYGKGKPTGLYSKAIRVLDNKPFVRHEFEHLTEDSEYVTKDRKSTRLNSSHK